MSDTQTGYSMLADAPYMQRRLARLAGDPLPAKQRIARRWPCANCRKPKSAVREGTRCTKCQADAKRKYFAERTEARRAKRKRLADARARKRRIETDPAVALYRAERAKRRGTDAQVEAGIAEARRILNAEAQEYSRDGMRKKRGHAA